MIIRFKKKFNLKKVFDTYSNHINIGEKVMAEDTKVVETSDEMKFTEEELQSLQNLQNGYQEKQALLGQLAVQRILLDQQSDALEIRTTEVEEEYAGVQQQERDLVEKLNVKYGPGSLNPDTGVFTPAPPVEESPEV